MSAGSLSQQAALGVARGMKEGLPKAQAANIAREAARENLTAYEVKEKVNRAVGTPMPALRAPSEIILAIPSSKKPLVDWTLRQYGSLASALEALQSYHQGRPVGETSAPDKSVPIGADAVMGTYRDPMDVVRSAKRRGWPEVFVGFNGTTGALLAAPRGPLPSGFVLICVVLENGAVQIPMTANGRGRTIGEGIKDSFMGPNRRAA